MALAAIEKDDIHSWLETDDACLLRADMERWKGHMKLEHPNVGMSNGR